MSTVNVVFVWSLLIYMQDVCYVLQEDIFCMGGLGHPAAIYSGVDDSLQT